MSIYEERELTIIELEKLLEQGREVEVTSPDGWVKVTDFINKGIKDCYKIVLANGLYCESAERHLFQLESDDWVLTKDLRVGHILKTVDGSSEIISKTRVKSQRVYDLTVDHSNHRYYTNGVVSHNTRRYKNSSGKGDDRLILSGQNLNLLSYFGGNSIVGINAQGIPSTPYSFIKKTDGGKGEVKRIIKIRDRQFNNWLKRKRKILKNLLTLNLKTKFSQKK